MIDNTKHCPKCQHLHDKKGIFCSHKCANSRGPRTQEFKVKIKKTIADKIQNGTLRKRAPGYRVSRIRSTCCVCNQEIEIKINDTKKHTCGSRECKRAICSKAGKISVSKRCKRSKNEITFYQLCLQSFPDALHNHIIADGWNADIVIPSKQIAIFWNGPWHYKQLNIRNHSLTQVQNRDIYKIRLFEALGWSVFVFEDRYYTPQTAFSKLVGDAGNAPTTICYEQTALLLS